MKNKSCRKQKSSLIRFRQVKNEENLDSFKTVAKRTIKIQDHITTKLDSIIYDPWYYKILL